MCSGSTYGQSYFFEFLEGWRSTYCSEIGNEHYRILGYIEDQSFPNHLVTNAIDLDLLTGFTEFDYLNDTIITLESFYSILSIPIL